MNDSEQLAEMNRRRRLSGFRELKYLPKEIKEGFEKEKAPPKRGRPVK